ncbi:MAG: hypothetical protein AAFV54_14675 [Pseudomonadota bacterium]
MADETEDTGDGEEPRSGENGGRFGRGTLLSLAAAAIAGISGTTYLATNSDDVSTDARPALMPASETQMQRPPVPRTGAGEVDFIVRFDDVPEIEECLDTFRQNPEHARSVFREWARNHPELSGFRLKKTNYSGELVLTWDGDGGRPGRDMVMSVRDKLQSAPMIKYADPDFSTQIEGDIE